MTMSWRESKKEKKQNDDEENWRSCSMDDAEGCLSVASKCQGVR